MNRRDFLRGCAAGALVCAVPSLAASSWRETTTYHVFSSHADMLFLREGEEVPSGLASLEWRRVGSLRSEGSAGVEDFMALSKDPDGPRLRLPDAEVAGLGFQIQISKCA
jgi:hypothetical protein